MSGGVHSCVAACLLKEQGYEIIGVTICLGQGLNGPATRGKRHPTCCSLDDIEDAKRVANKLKIPHYVVNFARALEEMVIKDFCQQYL